MNSKSKPLYWIVFVVYIIILVKVIFLNIPLDGVKASITSASIDRLSANLKIANFMPFRTINTYTAMYFKPAIKHLGFGILWFVPLGFFIPTLTKHKRFKNTMIIGSLTILIIELLQIITSLGVFDIDDIILNITGLMIGFMVYKAIK